MDTPDIALVDTGSHRVSPVGMDTEHLQRGAVAAEAAGSATLASVPRRLQASPAGRNFARVPAGCCRKAMAQRAGPPHWAAYTAGLPAGTLVRQDLLSANHSAKPAASDRLPARAHSRRPCSLRFPDSNPRDAACRTPCRKFWPDPSRRTAFGNRDRQVRSSVPVPLTEMKRISANLDQVAALQRAHADRLAGNKNRSS